MSEDMFKELIKETDNEYASIVDDGIASGDVSGYISTGSYSFNALVSGSIFNGIPENKVTALAGEPATGKTFYAINICREFLKANPTGFIFYFESESAITKEMMASRGLDTKRVAILPVSTIQEFRTQAIKILDRYMEKPKKGDKSEKPKMMMVLDSLGNLSTTKEVEDMTDGKETRDMTRAQLVRGVFRVLTLKLGKAKVPLLLTNHVYDVVGSYVPMKKMGGGSGLTYSASTIVFLSKKKDKTDNEVTGAIVTATLNKGRLTIENKKVLTLLNYRDGLDPYYGLLDIAEKTGIVKKVSTKYVFPDGTDAFGKHIQEDPEKYFTPELLKLIDEKCKEEFLYGTSNVMSVDEKEEE